MSLTAIAIWIGVAIGSATGLAERPASANADHRIEGCTASVWGPPDIWERRSVRAYVGQHGGSDAAALQWVRTQKTAKRLARLVELDPVLAANFRALTFDGKQRKVVVALGSRDYELSVSACAQEMGIGSALTVEITKWSDEELLAAVSATTGGAAAPLYRQGKFECSYGDGDYFLVEIRRSASRDERRLIREAAAATGVDFVVRVVDNFY